MLFNLSESCQIILWKTWYLRCLRYKLVIFV
uniref:Uncharacterized protein n=1 Tax=Rhizophora mucronata TaxID=61149 RepID=A0A2P2NRR6_RHIMU